MVYTDKVWASGNQIVAADMNRIEQGIKGRRSFYIVEPGGAYGDYATIQAAISAAEAAGGGDVIIRYGDGTIHSLLVPLTIDGDNINLIGEGNPTIKLANSRNCNMLEVCHTTPSSDIGVYGITFDGNRANQTVGNCIDVDDTTRFSMKGCVIKNAKVRGADIDNSDYPKVNECDFLGNGEEGLRFYESHHIIHSDCYFYDNSQQTSDTDYNLVIADCDYGIFMGSSFDSNSQATGAILENAQCNYSNINGMVARNKVSGPDYNVSGTGSIVGDTISV